MVTIVDDRNLGFSLGAVDYVTKPIDWQRMRRVLAKHRPEHPDGDILIVEDDANTRDMLRRQLQKDGRVVREAGNGRLALEELKTSLPSLILLDLMMPEMDGFEFMEAIRDHEEWRNIPVIVVTAKELTEEDHQRLNGRVVVILEKSKHDTAELIAEIKGSIRTKFQ